MRPGCNMFKQADSLAPELTALLKQDGAQSIACHITMQGNNDKEIFSGPNRGPGQSEKTILGVLVG
jgi:hypothetical protein